MPTVSLPRCPGERVMGLSEPLTSRKKSITPQSPSTRGPALDLTSLEDNVEGEGPEQRLGGTMEGASRQQRGASQRP